MRDLKRATVPAAAAAAVVSAGHAGAAPAKAAAFPFGATDPQEGDAPKGPMPEAGAS